MPILLDQLVDALRLGQVESRNLNTTAGQHGTDLRRHGFTISAVVHGYGDVCQSITELAVETNAPISADDFRMLNGCLDGAIANAVTEYSRAGGTAPTEAVDWAPSLTAILRWVAALDPCATVAFEVIRSGTWPPAGTGTALLRNLMAASVLVDRRRRRQRTPASSLQTCPVIAARAVWLRGRCFRLCCCGQTPFLSQSAIRYMANIPLYTFIGTNRDELLGRCRASGREACATGDPAEIDEGVPLFLDRLCEELRL